MADHPLSVRPEHLRDLKQLIAAHLPHEEVWAYGSRVTGTAHDTSDLDLVVRHPADLKTRQGPAFWALKEAFSESNLPFLVDLLDWATLPPAFWSNITESHLVLYHPGQSAEPAEPSACSGPAESTQSEQTNKETRRGLGYGE